MSSRLQRLVSCQSESSELVSTLVTNRPFKDSVADGICGRLTKYADLHTLHFMPYHVTDIDGLLKLMDQLRGEQTQAEFADRIGVSPTYLSNVYNRQREPGEKILSSLGITRQTVYQVPETLTSSAATASRGVNSHEVDEVKKTTRSKKD